MNKINVLHIIEDLNVGGLEELLSIIATGLNRDRYNIYVCCIEEGGQIAQELINHGIKVDILGINTYHNPFNILRLAKYIKERKIDIIHTHMYFANTFGRLAAILAKTPIVISATYSNYFEYKKRNILMERFLSRFTDVIIAASNSIKEFNAKQQRISLDKFKVIYDCASTEKFSKRMNSGVVKGQLGIEPDYSVVGCVARLSLVKGHSYLIRAAAEVLKRYPKVKFLLVGDGPVRKELENLTEELGIEDKVIFAGARRDIPEMLSVMDIFVLPSALREGCPLSVLEAMAMSKPVIASRLGGIPEEVSDGESGILVPPKDSKSLAEAIIKLLLDKSEARRMGQVGKKIFKHKFTKEIMLKKLESLYEELIAKKLSKRILYIDIHGDIWGGGQLSLLDTLEHLNKIRFKPIVIFPYEGNLSNIVRNLGIEVEIVPFGSIKITNIFINIISIFRFYILIKRRKIDLVHTNALRPTFYVGIVAKIAGVPLVWHARDLRSIVWLDRFLSFFVAYVIAISNTVAERFTWLKKRNRLSVIYNGIDIDKFRPQQKNYDILREFNIDSNTLIIGIVGHLEPRKGQIVFLETASKIIKKFPKTKFLLVGKDVTGKRHYQAKLESFISKLRIKDNVIFTGEREDIVEIMSVIDIFVCPFKYEAFGRVVIEAMALAKPIIAYNHSALPEIIEDGKTGILIEPDDKEGLEKVILKLLRDQDLRKSLGELARQRVRERFDLKFTIEKIQQLYEQILKKNNNN
jgi:glycosyltransferase involved in cell wall biosynthesis